MVLEELLARRAASAPAHPLLISTRGILSYEEGLRRALRLAAWLRARGCDRLGVAQTDPEDIVIALAGSAAVGVEACVYPRDLDAEGIAELATRLGHELVLRDGAPPETEEGYDPSVPPAGAAEAPVLVLTTGTTGEPKPVRHDWRRLALAVRHPDESSASRWLLGYNLNQFAGLQVLLHVLVSGSTLVAPASARAQDVIEALKTHSVTHVSATPTFWRILLGGLDNQVAAGLSLRQITLGGEAASESLLEKLQELFPDARVTHVYAGTEIGSVISVHDGHAGLPLTVLERDDDAEVAFKIIDGELHVRSRAGMLGYLGEGERPVEEWRPTGDMVEIRGNRIQFAGRTSEIINVGGAKVHPLPIEELVCGVEGVELAAVHGRPNPVTGQIVAVDVVASPGADVASVEARIREACLSLPRPGRPRRISFVESLQMSGHKVVRRSET